MIIDSVDPHYLGSNNGYQFTFLGRDTLLAFTENKEYELSEEFVWRALKKGDECYGILDGPTLASYGWYSSKPTEIAFGPAKMGERIYDYTSAANTFTCIAGTRTTGIADNVFMRSA